MARNRQMIRTGLIAFGLIFLHVWHCQGQPAQPQSVPNASHVAICDPFSFPRGALRRIGSPNFRLFYRDASSPDARILFSPDGKIVYRVCSGLTALDSTTGELRFRLRHGIRNHYTEPEGMLIECHFGTEAGKHVLIDYGTGRTLRSGPNRYVHGAFSNYPIGGGQRAIVVRYIRGHKYVAIHDLTRQKDLCFGGGSEWLLSPNETYLAAASGGTLAVWATQDGKTKQIFKTKERKFQLSWSDDGRHLFFLSHGNGMTVCSLRVSDGMIRVLIDGLRSDHFSSREGGHVATSPAAVSPNGKYVAYLDRQKRSGLEIRNWVISRTSDHSQVASVEPLPVVTTGSFSRDSNQFWMANSLGVAKYDIERGQIDPRSRDALSTITALSFSPDGTELFGVGGGEVYCWDVVTGAECRPRRRVNESHRLKRGRQCIWIGPDGRGSIWTDKPTRSSNGVPHRTTHYLRDGHKTLSDDVGPFWLPKFGRVVVTPDGKQLVRNRSGPVLIRLQTGHIVSRLLPRNWPFGSLMTISTADKVVAFVQRFPYARKAGDTLDIEVCDFAGKLRGVCKYVVPKGRDMEDRTRVPMIPMLLSDQGKELRVWHRGKYALWDVDNERLLEERDVKNSPTQVDFFTPNGSRFLRVAGKTLELVDIYTHQLCRSFECFDFIPSKNAVFAFSSDSSLLAVAVPNGPVILYAMYDRNEKAQQQNDQAFDELWTKLMSRNSAASYSALCKFIQHGDDSVSFLAKTLLTPPSVNDARVIELIEQLDDAQFAKRQSAHRELQSYGEAIEGHLRKIAKRELSLEQIKRIELLLKKSASWPLKAVDLRSLYAVEALEAIGTPMARNLLVNLAKKQTRIGRAARAATRRLSQFASAD